MKTELFLLKCPVRQMYPSFASCRGRPTLNVPKFPAVFKRCALQESSCLKRFELPFCMRCVGFHVASRRAAEMSSDTLVRREEVGRTLFSVWQKEELTREVQILQETRKVGIS